MLELKLQYFGHLMRRTDSLEKTLMLGKTEGRKRRGKKRMRWLHGITDSVNMLLLLLSRFSYVQLCATPLTAAHQAPPTLGLSRQEHWSGLPFPSPKWSESEVKVKVKVKSESEVAQSCPTPSDPMDCSPPGSSIHKIFQARVLEWTAIAFSQWTWVWAHSRV